ncbi:MAG: transposase [Bacteroidia bacterium]
MGTQARAFCTNDGGNIVQKYGTYLRPSLYNHLDPMTRTEQALPELKQICEKYPYMVKSWMTNWSRLFAYFKYPKEIRRIMYTTNMIESFHSQLRKIIKTKRVFSTDQSLLKLICVIYQNMKQGWTGHVNSWKLTYSQLMIIFEERIKQN